jgi:hypothetical protein
MATTSRQPCLMKPLSSGLQQATRTASLFLIDELSYRLAGQYLSRNIQYKMRHAVEVEALCYKPKGRWFEVG